MSRSDIDQRPAAHPPLPEELGQRGEAVLAEVVKEYILTGEPVGSSTVVSRSPIRQSASTVRNVMSSLEDGGLLHQPHTSAGRLPTDLGLRFFVDRLMQVRRLSRAERDAIMGKYDLTNVEVQELLRRTTRLLSDISRHCSLVLAPRPENAVLQRLEFVPLGPERMIAVLVMDSGLVQNRMLRLEHDLPGEELERVHRYLNDLCHGRELAEVRRLVALELDSERNRFDALVSRALTLGAQALHRPGSDEVLVGGQSHLLDQLKGHDRESLRQILEAIEQKRRVLRLLDQTISAQGVQVFIGAELGDSSMKDLSLVARAYGTSRPLGTLGVIGPSSMDYPRVVPLVDFAADVLGELLARG